MSDKKSSDNLLLCWLTAMRIPFTTVALAPFAVGFVWALSAGIKVSWTMGMLGEIAVFSICVCCHMFGEIFDQVEDRKTLVYGRSKFAGGTLMIAEGHIQPLHAGIAAILFLGLAFICGLIITIYYKSLILFGLGAFGAITAVLYSVPPLRLVRRGVGELFIGICYGWLTLTTGFATASGFLPSNSFLMSLPIAFSVFNIILINEFPDFQADMEAGKKNLMIRIGKESAAKVYGIVNLFIIISFLIICITLHPETYLYLLMIVPASMMALIISFNLIFLKKWQKLDQLEKFCGMTIILNHICSITLALLFICR